MSEASRFDVVAPGGTIGMINFTPEGLAADFFGLLHSGDMIVVSILSDILPAEPAVAVARHEIIKRVAPRARHDAQGPCPAVARQPCQNRKRRLRAIHRHATDDGDIGIRILGLDSELLGKFGPVRRLQGAGGARLAAAC
jgi:hypothetical protein